MARKCKNGKTAIQNAEEIVRKSEKKLVKRKHNTFNTTKKEVFFSRLLVNGFNITEAAKFTGIALSTFYKYLEKDVDTNTRFVVVKRIFADKLRHRSITEGLNKSVPDRIFQLKHLNPKEYGDRNPLVNIDLRKLENIVFERDKKNE